VQVGCWLSPSKKISPRLNRVIDLKKHRHLPEDSLNVENEFGMKVHTLVGAVAKHPRPLIGVLNVDFK